VASTRKPARVSAVCLLAAGIGAGSLILLRACRTPGIAGRLAAITVDYPAIGSVFPPEITARLRFSGAMPLPTQHRGLIDVHLH
jgi:hypothetical protein